MATMMQPYPLDPQDDVKCSVEDLNFAADGETLATFAHEYEDGAGFEIHSKTAVGNRVTYFARFTDDELPDGTVRSVTFHLVGNGTPPQQFDRTVTFVVKRSSADAG